MIIIGEKINGTIPRVSQAIAARDEAFIRNLAVKQSAAGASYIDICAGTSPDMEEDTLMWLMNIVQDAIDTPICIDSPNPKMIAKVFKYAKKPGLINSVSEEGEKCNIIFPLIQGTEWEVIALTCDNKGIPSDVETRVNITKTIVEKADKCCIALNRIHIDPLVMALSTDNKSFLNFLATLKTVKELYPTIKVTSGLSNISFGMPLRRVINQHFFAVAIYAGMDSAIMDPLNKDMMTTLLAMEVLLGRDRLCRNFSNAYRKGKIGSRKQTALGE